MANTLNSALCALRRRAHLPGPPSELSVAIAGVFHVTHLHDSAVDVILNVMLGAERYVAGCLRFTQLFVHLD